LWVEKEDVPKHPDSISLRKVEVLGNARGDALEFDLPKEHLGEQKDLYTHVSWVELGSKMSK
jgi:hypothetical protein